MPEPTEGAAAQTNQPADAVVADGVGQNSDEAGKGIDSLYPNSDMSVGDTDAGNAPAEGEATGQATEVKPDDAESDGETIKPIEKDPTIEPVDGGEADKDAEGDKSAEGAEDVIEYADFTLPEGQSMDQEALDALLPIAKQHKLPQDAVQGIIDIAAGMLDRQAQEQELAIENQEKIWKTEILKDPEIGGAKHVQAAAAGEKALKMFDPAGEMGELLKIGRLTNNPTVRKFLARVGQSVSEDAFVPGTPMPNQASGAKVLYPNSDLK